MRGNAPWRSVTMSWPSTRTMPEVGSSRPSSMEMVVVFPAPLPPSSPVTAPARTVKLMPSTATSAPNRLVRSRTRMAGSGSLVGAA